MEITIENGRYRLLAKDGNIITDGKETFGYDITLELGMQPDAFYALPQTEYEKIRDEREREIEQPW